MINTSVFTTSTSTNVIPACQLFRKNVNYISNYTSYKDVTGKLKKNQKKCNSRFWYNSLIMWLISNDSEQKWNLIGSLIWEKQYSTWLTVPSDILHMNLKRDPHAELEYLISQHHYRISYLNSHWEGSVSLITRPEKKLKNDIHVSWTNRPFIFQWLFGCTWLNDTFDRSHMVGCSSLHEYPTIYA